MVCKTSVFFLDEMSFINFGFEICRRAEKEALSLFHAFFCLFRTHFFCLFQSHGPTFFSPIFSFFVTHFPPSFAHIFLSLFQKFSSLSFTYFLPLSHTFSLSFLYIFLPLCQYPLADPTILASLNHSWPVIHPVAFIILAGGISHSLQIRKTQPRG